jgi:hypothetical protein
LKGGNFSECLSTIRQVRSRYFARSGCVATARAKNLFERHSREGTGSACRFPRCRCRSEFEGWSPGRVGTD